MRSYEQFCPIARASEVLSERWTTIIVRNLLLGCRTFNEVAEGAPGINRSLLSQRLKQLEHWGIISRRPNPGGRGRLYELTEAGRELDQVCDALGIWGTRWLEVHSEHTDPRVVLWALCRGLDTRELPQQRVVVRFDLRDQVKKSAYWLLVQQPKAEVCYRHPGYDEDLTVATDPESLAKWHMGRMSLEDGMDRGVVLVEGPPRLRRLLSSWGGLDPFARVQPVPVTKRRPAGPISVLEPRPVPGNGGAGPTPGGIEMATTTVTPIGNAAVEDLRSRFRGTLIRPDDRSYEEARQIWNGDIDRRPGLIARCAGPADVIAAVRFARERDLLVAVRGGGHSYAGHSVCDDGLMIDLSPMKGIRVDLEGGTAWAEGGVLWGELDRETQTFGLATTGGVVSHTGIAGLTLGGGIGHLMRKHGMTVDNLQSVDLVTADGEFLTVDKRSEPELFWGLRGGGGNFGIATSFRYRLHPVGPTVLGGLLVYPAERGGEVLRFVRDFVAAAPDEVGGAISLRLAPALPAIPEELHFEPIVAVLVCYSGALEEGDRVLAPLRGSRPVVDLIQPMPYTAVQTALDKAFPHGRGYYTKGLQMSELSDEVIEILLEGLETITSQFSATSLFMLGGAMGRVPAAETAVANRHGSYDVNLTAAWARGEGRDDHVAWVRRAHEALSPHASGVYANFLSDDGGEGIERAYGRNLARLGALKDRYDPDNVFRLNQNITPSRRDAPRGSPSEV